MTAEIHDKFEQVRDHLKQLGNGVADLAQNHADILDTPNLQNSLLKFRQAYEESVARVANPNFTIATIGTTSSGKSTIVNALIGRKIAPIEAGEMSGGVLTIKHSKEFKLLVAETEGAQWETGTWTDLNDIEIYDRIRTGVMFPYHQARQKQDLIAPQVTAHVPILPAEDSSLLGLPEGIGIEFIDLPGLKSIQDRDNLKVIQQQVHKTFSLVALDYLQVDDRHRKRLLEELKKVVEYLQGRTDSMIFILNRVDQRGQDDITIAERIEQLQLEIQETLNLDRLPDIIPLSGRFLYYAQCAWGTNAIGNNSAVDTATRQHFLSGMLEDCSSLIRSHTSEDRTLKKWFRDLEDRIDDGETIDDESMRKVIYHVNNWSGGDRLWKCMRDRVQESFSELVILPALIDVLERYKLLVNTIDVEVNIKKIGEKEELETKQQNIIDGSERLAREVENIRDRFQQEIRTIIDLLKQDSQSDRNNLEQKGIESFDRFPDTSIQSALKVASKVRMIMSDQALQIAPELEPQKMLLADVATQGWAVATATEAHLLLEVGKFQEAQELLHVEVPRFKQNAEQWANNLLNNERPELNTAYRFTAPVFKQHINRERVVRIADISSSDRNLSLEKKQEKQDDIAVEFQMSYAAKFDRNWIYQQVAIAEYLDTFSELSARLETLQSFATLCQKTGVKSSLELLPSKQEEGTWYTLPC